MRTAFVIVLLLGTGHQPKAPTTLRVSVQGETNLTTTFVEVLRREAHDRGMDVQLVERRSEQIDYSILIAQETTLDSAAAAVIAVDKNGDIVTSVVRSGRLTGKGAINACTKELAKRLAVLRK